MAPEEIYWKAKRTGWSKKSEDAIINSGNATSMRHFAYDIKGANIPRLERAIIDSGSFIDMVYFALDIPGANIPKLQQAIIDSGNLGAAFDFARFVKDANVSDLIDFVLINEPELIKKLFMFRPDLRNKYELGE